jgi:3-oxoacyl-[acyl-carrier protein] reductase
MELADKVAVITGAGRGIGRALAVGLAEAGASVCCSARSKNELEQTVSLITQKGGKAIYYPADVTDAAALERLFQLAASSFAGVDIVIINAGMASGRVTVEASDLESWKRVIEVNLLGAYHTARAAIPYLKARGGGKIITIGSGLGHKGQAGGSAYAVSKAGLWMLTRVLAQELAEDNISVNELIPGPVETEMNRSSPFKPDGEWFKQAEEVVPLALFLVSQPNHGPTAQSFSLMRRDG